MLSQEPQLPWETPQWLEEVTAWIETHVARHGLRATGPLEMVHQRAWSAFAQLPTEGGKVYFKAPAPTFHYEAPLAEALARWRPAESVPVLAVDVARGWILSADAGPTLRQVTQAPDQVEHWLRLVPRNAALQLAMVGHVPDLIAMGMPDRRLAVLPGLYAALIADPETLLVDQESGVSAAEYQRLLDLRPQVAAWCAELASYGLPETLTHEEVHDANVLVGGAGYIFTDWSDSSIAHPFFTMLVTMRAAADRLGLAEDGPEMGRLRDVYLEAWAAFAPRPQLLAAFGLAYRLGMINRALSWHHGTDLLPKHYREQYAYTVPAWLQDFLNHESPA